MMTRFVLLLFVALGCVSLAGCQDDGKPAPLSPEQEKQLEEQLKQAQQAEGAAAEAEPEAEKATP